MTRFRERELCRGFREIYGRSPDVLVRAPGRVNLLGAHVDYNDGWVLPAAIDRSLWLAAGRSGRPRLRVHSLDLGDSAAVPLQPPPAPPACAGRPLDGWIEYPAGVAWALAEAGYDVTPIDALVGSDLPMGAGVSSSAALEVAFLLAWAELGRLELSAVEMALLGRRVENEFLDVQSGIMDQFTSLCGSSDHVLLLDCRTLEWERLPLPSGLGVLVADSGVRRRLVDGGINDRRRECQQALERLRSLDGGLRALRDASPELLTRARGSLPETLYRRALHVIEECGRVQRGAALLRQGDGAPDAADALGGLVVESHRSSRDLYEVSIPELDVLVEVACETAGCYGARLAGAGFGGCVTVLVEAARAGDVAHALERGFGSRFGRNPEILGCRIGNGAEVVPASRWA